MTAYLVLDFSILDFGAFREYIDGVPAFIAKHDGRYIVQGVEPEIMEGDWAPERMVIIEFPSKKHAREFLEDSEFQDLKAIRKNNTISKLILVEGCV